MERHRRLSNLAWLIPGYAGYRTKEDRRDADKQLRMYLAGQYVAERENLTILAQHLVASGRLDLVARLEPVEQMLARFIARLETAPRGYGGWFSATELSESDLEKLYEFDAKLADGIPLLREQIGFVSTECTADADCNAALNALRDFVDNLNTQFDNRQTFLAANK